MSSIALHSQATDENIQAAFIKSYVYKMYLQNDSIKAHSKRGVVTLTGTVAEDSSRALAQEVVANLPGVIRVYNQLETKAEIDSESADLWIGRRVKLTLLFHRNVNAGATTVEVKEGNVTLKGEASSLAQKELTEEYTKDIEGVNEVKNEMTLATSPEKGERSISEEMDDASVTAQVRTALFNHRSTSSFNTKVESRKGEVVLTGIAKNPAEKSLVTKLVSDIYGVSNVKNQMTVEEPQTK